MDVLPKLCRRADLKVQSTVARRASSVGGHFPGHVAAKDSRAMIGVMLGI
jgi:hypothetical protein